MRQIRVGSYVFDATDSPADLFAALRLRTEVYVEEGFTDSSSLSGGLVTDAFDDVGVTLLARDAEGDPAGTVSFVPPSPLGLRIDQVFVLAPLPVPRGLVGELSRLAVARAHRGNQHVLLGLLAGLCAAAADYGVAHLISYLPRGLIEYFQTLDFSGTPVAVNPHGPEIDAQRRWMRGFFESGEIVPILYSRDALAAAVEQRLSWIQER